MNPDQYRSVNSYVNDEGDRIPAMHVTAVDVLILMLRTLGQFFEGLAFLTKANYNRQVERAAVEMEMRADIEAIQR